MNFLHSVLLMSNCEYLGFILGVAFNQINNVEFDQVIEAAGRFGPGVLATSTMTKPTFWTDMEIN